MKYVDGSFGSPQTIGTVQVNVSAALSPPSSVISTMWPNLLAVRGFSSSGPGKPVLPRLLLLVNAAYTLPVCGLGSTSSGRSSLVAPTLSAASRVWTRASSTVKPSTSDLLAPA